MYVCGLKSLLPRCVIGCRVLITSADGECTPATVATESEVVEKEKSTGGLLGNEAFVLGTLPTPLLLEKHITVRGQGEK